MTQHFRAQDQLPVNVEAEQQTLGALLLDNARIATVAARGGADLFGDPVHAEIFAKMARMERDSILASPVTLREWASAQEGMRELGGAKYLARLAGASISGSSVGHYADLLAETKSRRDLTLALREAQGALTKSDEPAAAIANRLESTLLSMSEVGTGPKPTSMMAAVTKAMQQSTDAAQGNFGSFVRTGIPSLDGLVTGLYPGELVLLGGRPSMGKTSVALNIALNAARAGNHVVICSLEMNPEAMALRALSERTAELGKGITYRDIRQGVGSPALQAVLAEAAREVANLPIQFLSRDYSEIGAMMAGAKQARRVLGDDLGLLVVDYAQLLKVQGARSRYDEVSEISRTLKALAGQMNVPVLALSQLSRNLESRDDKRPMMSDLRESGQLEQDADAVFFCYRDEYYIERDKPDTHDIEKLDRWQRALDLARNRLEIIVAKQRQGPIGTANVMCNVALNRIWEG